MKTQIKTLAFAALAALLIGAATTPALADNYRGHMREGSIDYRLERLEDRIDRGVRTRELNRFEADRLRDELRDISRLSWRFERSGRGVDRQEMAILDSKLDRLSARVAYNRNDRDYRHNDHGYRRY